MPWRFENTYSKLPESFFERINPTPVKNPRLLKFNFELASELGLERGAFSSEQLAQYFSGNQIFPGSEPLAQAYAGHQFGNFVPQLGDGRAILLGEIIDLNRNRRDVQLKGSGRTRFSRGGDGRAALGPVIREYVLGEAMFRLGIPTTRGLAVVETGEEVRRETPLPGAVLARVAASHIRVGTFEYFAWRGDVPAVKTLADYVIDRHYPEINGDGEPYRKLFEKIVERQARLIAQWSEVGFIHGVMNTDNMTISGETIDFGPCAFIDEYEPTKVFSSIDHQGRYSFENQPRIAMWNLSVLAHCLRPILDQDEKNAKAMASDVLSQFQPVFQQHLMAGARKKLGLVGNYDGDDGLVQDFFALLRGTQADYTLSFRYLSSSLDEGAAAADLRLALANSDQVEPWLAKWRARCREGNRTIAELTTDMLAVNPAYIARNHLVEAAIKGGVEDGNMAAMERLLEAVGRPFEEREHLKDLMAAPRPEEKVTETFCGT